MPIFYEPDTRVVQRKTRSCQLVRLLKSKSEAVGELYMDIDLRVCSDRVFLFSVAWCAPSGPTVVLARALLIS